MSGTSMAAPHVAGVAAVTLGNARALTPAEVAGRLSADATTGSITGLNATTVNALLYQRPSSNASGTAFDDEESADSVSNDNGADSVYMDYGPESPVVEAPTSAPSDSVRAPIAAPVTAPVRALARITSTRKVGKTFRIVVAAPRGSRVVVYRNGKAVASGTRTTFSVSLGRAKSAQFHAVAESGGSFLVTPKVILGNRTQSTRK
jgi:hypothetical protein